MNERGYKKLTFKWIPLEQVKDLKLYPLFVKGKIMNLPKTTQHIVEIKE